ncbi:MAG: ATP-binding protein [Saprospirales bacterium]|nr:ATP-binding protein [Saprospirales bacterium]
MGYKTLYLNMNRFIEKIAAAKLDGSYVKILNQIEKIPLLILDDFGLQPLDQNLRLALLQILEDRYAKKPIVVASQLPVSEWYNYTQRKVVCEKVEAIGLLSA